MSSGVPVHWTPRWFIDPPVVYWTPRWFIESPVFHWPPGGSLTPVGSLNPLWFIEPPVFKPLCSHRRHGQDKTVCHSMSTVRTRQQRHNHMTQTNEKPHRPWLVVTPSALPWWRQTVTSTDARDARFTILLFERRCLVALNRKSDIKERS